MSITPNRYTRLHFDLPETTVREGFYGGCRLGSRVASYSARNLGRDDNAVKDMRYWPHSKCWTLAPLQDRVTDLQEAYEDLSTKDIFRQPPPGSTLYDLSLAYAKEHVAWNKAVGQGIVHEPGMREQWDFWLRKNVPAGADWYQDFPVSFNPPQQDPASGLHTNKVPLDCMLEFQTSRDDQGWSVRWYCPGTLLMNPDYILNIYFGQFCLAVSGDGYAHLCEYCSATVGGTNRWKFRKTFRYCRSSQVSGNVHHMMIFPCRGPNGEKVINFAGNLMESVKGEFSRPGGPISTGEEYYISEQIVRGNDVDPYPDAITGPGLQIDIRRDLRVAYSVTDLLFRNNGTIVDSAWKLPPFGTDTPLALRFFASIPSGDYQFTAQVFDRGAGGGPLTAATAYEDGDPLLLTVPDVPPNTTIGVQFSMGSSLEPATGFIRDTPRLYGYQLHRETVVSAITPGMFDTPIRSINVVASNPNVEQDTGEASVMDATDAWPRLRTRGELSVKATVYAEGLGEDRDETGLITIFRGKVIRPRRTKYGIDDAKIGAGGTGATRLYPSPEWSEYNLLLSGMAHRAQEHHSGLLTLENFAQDESAPIDPVSGVRPPWKVTDILTRLLRVAGFPANMVEIEDSPIRLWLNLDSPASDQWYTPETDLLGQCIALTRNYLGGYLVFDTSGGPLAGAGRSDEDYPEGSWKVLYPAAEGATPIFNFVTKPTNPLALPTHPFSYPHDTTWAEGVLDSYVIPPERNHFHVFTAPEARGLSPAFRVSVHLYNFQSFQVPGSSVTPDPDNPHYLGRERLLILPDPTLFVEGPNGWQRTQQAVLFVAYRLLNYIGRARIVQPVHAPLSFVKDAVSGRWRMMRYGDPVTWKGQTGWYVRSVKPSYTLDTMQMAWYELEFLVPL